MQLELLDEVTWPEMSAALDAGHWTRRNGKAYFVNACDVAATVRAVPRIATETDCDATTITFAVQDEPTATPDEPTPEAARQYKKGDVINGVLIKSSCEVLRAWGVANYSVAGAALKITTALRDDGTLGKILTVPIADMWDAYKAAPGINDSVRVCYTNRKNWLARSPMAGLHYLFAERDREAADKFAAKVLRGRGLPHGDPVRAVREAILAATKNRNVNQTQKAAAVIVAWNYERAGESLKHFEFERFKAPCEAID
jgi:hypothetical protein